MDELGMMTVVENPSAIIAFGVAMLLIGVCLIVYIIIKADTYRQIDDVRIRDLLAEYRTIPEDEIVKRKAIMEEIECLASKTR